MSDLINRQAALDALSAIDTSIIPFAKAREYVEETIEYAKKILANMPDAERTAVVDYDTRFPIEICGECHSAVMYPEKYCCKCGARLEWNR